MWTLIGISAAVLAASAIFVLHQEAAERKHATSMKPVRP
jgi:hypothetical protein